MLISVALRAVRGLGRPLTVPATRLFLLTHAPLACCLGSCFSLVVLFAGAAVKRAISEKPVQTEGVSSTQRQAFIKDHGLHSNVVS